MRILFSTSGYFPDMSGGAEHQARLQAEELTRRGHFVNVVCPRRRGTSVSFVGGVRVYRLPVIERRYLQELTYCFMLSLFLLWHMRRFQLVHIHMTHLDSVITCAIAWAFRRPVYAKIARGGDSGDARYLARAWYLRRIALAYPARFQCISEQILSDLRAVGVAAERLIEIPNGVEHGLSVSPAPEERHRRRQHLGLPADAVVVLFLGRYATIKGIDVLLDAWAGLPRSGAVLALVGRRPWNARVSVPESQTPGRTPIGDVLDFEWSDDPGEWTANADIFVLPSRGEGMSNALLRAMSDGLAVIATRVGAAEVMIEDGVSGCLVDVGDVSQLRSAISELIGDEARRIEFGAAAKARVARDYSIESVVDRIEVQYNQVLGRA